MYQVIGYHRPTSLPQALQLLDSGDRVPLAGGVHLHHDGGADPTELVDLQAAGLDTIEVDPASARLGAMVRLQTLVDEQRLPESIREAARAEQPSTLRTLATVGGTIAAAADHSLLLAALLAHDTSVRLASEAHGERTASLAELLAEGRRAGELVAEITVATDGVAAAAHTGRTPRDVPIVGVVVRRVADTLTFGLCGVAATPIRVESDQLASLEPIDDHRATAAYRTHLVEVLTGRLLEQLS
jgi:CO/xanthine dehydrogenase FAD-binding subunit